MPTVTIKNFRGISTGLIALHPQITLIAGANGNGKTSTAQAIGCLLTGTTTPVSGLAKKHNQHLLHNGAMSGTLSLDNYTLTFPDCKPAGTRTLTSSEYAAGVKPLTEITADELAKLIGTQPTEADITAAGIADQWEYIQRQGWDAAYTRANADGVELKSMWRLITHEQYGSKKAESWAPEHYDRTVDEAALIDGIEESNNLLSQATSQRAVAEHQREELQKLANDADNAMDALLIHEQSIQYAALLLKDAIDQRSAAPAMTSCAVTYDWTCTGCAKDYTLALKGDDLVIHDGKKPTRAAIKRQQAALQKLTAAVSAAELSRDQALANFATANDYANQCRRAKQTLASADSAPYIDAEPAEKLVEVLTEKLAALTSYRKAYTIHEQITANAHLQSVLAPDGLRKTILSQRLSGFNTQLRELSDTAGWAWVQLDDDLMPTYGKRPYKLLSASEQFRTTCTLQVAIAQLDNSGCIVIDAADILDSDGRNGLITLLIDAGIPALVAMTFNERADAPDLNAAGIGCTYWVSGGVVSELQAVTA